MQSKIGLISVYFPFSHIFVKAPSGITSLSFLRKVSKHMFDSKHVRVEDHSCQTDFQQCHTYKHSLRENKSPKCCVI